jgi:hypothetical protein
MNRLLVSFRTLRRRRSRDFAVAPDEMQIETIGGLVSHEQEGSGRTSVRKSKEQANRADLFFGWNRVDKTH